MSTLVCLDASVVIPLLVPHRWSDPVTALLARWQREDGALIAPALLAFEVTAPSAVWSPSIR